MDPPVIVRLSPARGSERFFAEKVKCSSPMHANKGNPLNRIIPSTHSYHALHIPIISKFLVSYSFISILTICIVSDRSAVFYS